MDKVIKTMEERWDQHSEKYDANHQGHISDEDLARWNHFLETHIGNEKQQKIFDVGCGTGFLTTKIAALGYDCQGLDLSGGMLGIAEKKARAQGLTLEFMKGNVADLPLADASIDTITNRSLLWTLLEPQKALKEWLRVLKPNGRLLCFCSVGKMDNSCHHYEQEIEEKLALKGAAASDYCRQLEQAGFGLVEAVLLEGIHSHHGNSPWYVIKGRKI